MQVATIIALAGVCILALVTTASADYNEDRTAVIFEKRNKRKNMRDVEKWLKREKIKIKKTKNLRMMFIEEQISDKKLDQLRKKKGVKMVVRDVEVHADTALSGGGCEIKSASGSAMHCQDQLDDSDDDWMTWDTTTAFNSRDVVDVFVVDLGIRGTHDEWDYPTSTSRYQKTFDAYPGNTNLYGGHGTKVAGLAVGTTYGAAHLTAQLHDIRVFSHVGASSMSDFANGIDAAVDEHKTHSSPHKSVIVMAVSVNTTQSNTSGLNILETATEDAVAEAGMYFVASAGNDNQLASINIPCNVAGVICVASVNTSGHMTGSSNYGSRVDIMSFGDDCKTADKDSDTDTTETFKATSSATGIVGGYVAFYLADAHAGSRPSTATVKNHLVNNALPAHSNSLKVGTPSKVMTVYPPGCGAI